MKVLNLEFDDYTNDEYGSWSQICENHLTEIRQGNPKTVKEKVEQVDEGLGFGICGVKGCSDEADHYIDFK